MYNASKTGVHIKEVLMKLNICRFLIRDNELLEKYNEIWEKSARLLKKALTVSLDTMKNI